jgi:putative DNA primase/helicase
VDVTADEALAATAEAVRDGSAIHAARRFLQDALKKGARAVTEVEAEAEADGISDRTLRRARKALGVRAKKVGFPGEWVWQLPDEGGQS